MPETNTAPKLVQADPPIVFRDAAKAASGTRSSDSVKGRTNGVARGDGVAVGDADSNGLGVAADFTAPGTMVGFVAGIAVAAGVAAGCAQTILTEPITKNITTRINRKTGITGHSKL